MNEKISNKLLAIPVAISFSVIFIFCIFCIGLSKVEASSYSWSTPQVLQFTNSSTMNEGIAHICGTTNSCNYNNGNNVANYIQARYRIQDNTINDQNGIEPNTYTVKFRIRLVGLDRLTKNNLKFKMVYYPTTSSTYGTATCDGAETYNIVYNNNSDNDVYADYTCETFKVTTPFTHFGIIIGNTPNTLFLAQISQQLIFIGPGEATNDDVINSLNNGFNNIINNQNHNTSDIINNQNQNKNDIINNQNQNQQQTNQGLEDIESAITDETAPNLDAFNNMSGWLPPGPLDSVLNIPLNILNGLVGAFNNNTCSPISIPIPFIGGNLVLPCLYNLYSSINGLSIALTTFFTAISGYLMFKYLSNLYVWIDKTLKMEESSYMQDWGGV